ncbi:ATP-dependent endonuclease [Microbacterium sp.]|uniref:ATP-dependent endonuclease n=1 Tax=Microbacterium sp. TaxID=51671 RepID=UPI002FE236DB
MTAGDAVEQRTVILFEGRSDRLAFEAVARRCWVSPDVVQLVDMGGITNLRTRVSALREADDAVRVLGLYDAAEEAYVIRILTDIGMLAGGATHPADVGFFGCERDLEAEVIRAAGAELVFETLAARGELERFRVFQGQPAQRGKPVDDQLHRFAGTAAGRKARFAADVIDVLPIDRMPPPLTALLRAALPAS